MSGRITYGKNHRRAKPPSDLARRPEAVWYCSCGAQRSTNGRGEHGRGGWILTEAGAPMCSECARKYVRVRFELSAIVYVPCELADAWNVFVDAIRHPGGATTIGDYTVRRRTRGMPSIELSKNERAELGKLLRQALAELLGDHDEVDDATNNDRVV